VVIRWVMCGDHIDDVWSLVYICLKPRLQHTATHCNTLQLTATHRKTLHRTATRCNTHCNALQSTCNILQHLIPQMDHVPAKFLATMRLCVCVCVCRHTNLITNNQISVSPNATPANQPRSRQIHQSMSWHT